LGYKVIVGATFYDLALVHDNNLIGILDGTQAMGDNHHSLLTELNQFVQGLLN
jgi:hypothetical protein